MAEVAQEQPNRLAAIACQSSSTGLVYRCRLGMSTPVELVHDRDVLQLGPAGAPLALLLFRPRGRRIVVEHSDDPMSSMGAITTLRPGLCRELLDSGSVSARRSHLHDQKLFGLYGGGWTRAGATRAANVNASASPSSGDDTPRFCSFSFDSITSLSCRFR